MAFRNKTPFWQLSVFRVLVLQVMASLLLAAVAGATLGLVAGYSVALGGSLVFLPHAWFAWKAFRYYGARSATAIVQSFWSGLAGKMMMTAVLFALVFAVVKPLSVAGLFAGYVLIQLTGTASLLLMKNF